jgi:transcription initiation factor IIF auxiliary subunit
MAVINLMFFASINDTRSLFTLLIVGFLTSFFSKNMIVILFISLVFTHILKYGTKINEGINEIENFDLIEGMENEMPESGESKKKSDSSQDKKNEKSDSTEDKKSKQKNNEPMSQLSKSEYKKNNDMPTVKSLQKDFLDFQSIQEKILKGMKEIDPLLSKAENFIEKFERYKNREEFNDETD